MFIMKSANEVDKMRLSASAQFVSLPIRVVAALIQALMEKCPKSPSTISKAKPLNHFADCASLLFSHDSDEGAEAAHASA